MAIILMQTKSPCLVVEVDYENICIQYRLVVPSKTNVKFATFPNYRNLKDNGNGYLKDEDQIKYSNNQLLTSSAVGDGGASWRGKALKRVQEHATCKEQNFKEVVQERWGSLGHLAVASNIAATHAHLHAINSRRMGAGEEAEKPLQCSRIRLNGSRKTRQLFLFIFRCQISPLHL